MFYASGVISRCVVAVPLWLLLGGTTSSSDALNQASIVSVERIHELLRSYQNKQLHSSNWSKAWRTWSRLAVNSIRSELQDTLPCEVDDDATKQLAFQLGVAADVGTMPPFECQGALAGYSLNYFTRSLLTADLLILENIQGMSSCVPRKVCSIGGGPGYDHVATALVASFLGEDTDIIIETSILDYEIGWKNIVETMGVCVNAVLRTNHALSFGRCDITQPLHHATNRHFAKTQFDLYLCQYCVAENHHALLQSNYVFFRELLDMAPNRAVFVFTETTHRLWPDFCDWLNPQDFFIELIQRGGGYQMVITKEPSLASEQHSEMVQTLLKELRQDQQRQHDRVQRGVQRQQRKIRGAK